MNKIYIYGHGGAYNHGNEAIVRGIKEIFSNKQVVLYSDSPEVDIIYGLDKICEIRNSTERYKAISIKKIISVILGRLFYGSKIWIRWHYAPLLNEIDPNGFYILEAGDQYCESSGMHIKIYSYINNYLQKYDCKTVMMGCTINSDIIENKRVIHDLKKYSLIIARESITYSNLKKNGISNCILKPDPAFAMQPEICELPEFFIGNENRIIAVNIGFLAQGNEIYTESLIRCTKRLVEYLLKNTDYYIALIAHVNWDKDRRDNNYLRKLLIKGEKRISEIPEYNAPQTKYILSKCKAFFALRTHASISAIGVYTPVLFAGYKTKTRGICKDIFGDAYDRYFCDLTCLNENEIIKKVSSIISNVNAHEFNRNVDLYVQRVYEIKDDIEKLD